MKTIFEYRDWNPERERDLLDNPPHHQYTKDDPNHHLICPEPTCLKEWEETDASGPVVCEESDGEITGVAQPCEEHISSFQFSPGWYQDFADALYRKDWASLENEDKICYECGAEYRIMLWGWSPFICPDCIYRTARTASTGQS